MTITTSIARHYGARMIIFGIVFLLLGLWGAFDLWVKIPSQERLVDQYEQLQLRLDAFASLKQRQEAAGLGLTEQQMAEVEQIEAALNTLAPDGDTPARPGKFDRLTQWLFLLCLPCAPYFFWRFARVRRRVYRLDGEGTLSFPGGSWAVDEIVDVDMSRWMAKSVAWAVHRDGRRVKLDDYVHGNMDRIIGRLATRFHPEKWDESARSLDTPEDEPAPPEDADQGTAA